MATHIDTLIIGAGQAGLALSYHLSAAGHDHVLLEGGGLGQRWIDRWDSLTLLSPNWMNGLPGGARHADPDGFLDRAAFISYLRDYARSFSAPVVERAHVTRVERSVRGFLVRAGGGDWLARRVVVATGDADLPHVPLTAPPGIPSLHAASYRRPELVPGPRVLVVGGGASGQQLALELARAGREVVLSVGRHSRAPRAYRGHDVFEWLQLLGDFDRTVDEVPDLEAAKRVPLFPVSGANGGEDLGLDRLQSLGVRLVGRLAGFDGRRALFADDLARNVAKADERLVKLLARIDAHPLVRGAPELPAPIVVPPAPRELDLGGSGAIVWATGFRRAYPWLRIPGALDERGEIVHRRGVTRVTGLYVLGLAFQYRRSSHFIGGVGQDAEFLAARIASSRRRRSTGLRPAYAASR
jgi:putative flavoprotein involved in K+ transport